MSKKKTNITKYMIPVGIIVAVIIAIVYFFFFSAISKGNGNSYLYIDEDDNIDSIYAHLDTMVTGTGLTAIRTMVRQTEYNNHIRTGRYELEEGMGAFTFFRHMRNGLQAPIMLSVPSVRTKARLANELSKHLMLSSDAILTALNDETTCEKYNLDTCTIISMFIPNTYEIYWNISVEKLLSKMSKLSDQFWEGDRQNKAKALKLTPVEVITLASIVDEETANNGEKPMIAGMYYNRLMQNMPLQADPTVKFALQDFGLRRIYNSHLMFNSPYNTYRNEGLPPGPIRIPSIAGIDAVLNMVHHEYLFMCAKEDFSGTHNFAKTYEEHLQNARKYTEALNKRGIK